MYVENLMQTPLSVQKILMDPTFKIRLRKPIMPHFCYFCDPLAERSMQIWSA